MRSSVLYIRRAYPPPFIYDHRASRSSLLGSSTSPSQTTWSVQLPACSSAIAPLIHFAGVREHDHVHGALHDAHAKPRRRRRLHHARFFSQLLSASLSFSQLLSASPNSTDILFIMTGFLITNGVNDGVGVYAMGLHGCLCNAGFYCLRGQCVPTPAGPLACRYAAAPAPHPALHSSYAAERPPHCLAY